MIGVYPPGKSDCTLMSSGRRVIVFDTPEMATQFLPLLGNGRVAHWGADGESVSFAPLSETDTNRAVVLTGYDPYNAPNGRSESPIREWRHHLMWSHWWSDCGQEISSCPTS